jgi:hypothetical protein
MIKWPVSYDAYIAYPVILEFHYSISFQSSFVIRSDIFIELEKGDKRQHDNIISIFIKFCNEVDCPNIYISIPSK